MAGMNIGDIWSSLRVDGKQARADVVKAAGDAGTAAGKTLGDKWKESFTRQNIGKGLIQGLGLGAGLTAVNAVTAGISAVAGAFTDSVDAARQFDSQLRTINTVAGVSDAQLGRIGDRIQELSRETGKTTDELTQGFYDLVSAGVPAEHAMGVLRDSAILATGALGTTGETVDLITSALNAYKLEATQSTRVTDIFAAAVRDGKVTAAELGTSLAQVAPLASAAGVSLEEVAAGYAQLTKNGVPAAQAATQMRAAISALLTPNAQLAKIQSDVNANFAEMARSDGLAVALQRLREAAGSDEAFAKALGSVEALSFSLLTTGENAGAFEGQLRSVEDAARDGGVALGQYEERAKGAEVQDARRAAELKTLMQDFGELVEPIYDALIGASSLVIQTVRDLGEAFHDLQRFLSPHLAVIEDVDRALVELAQQHGINEDALLSFAAAERQAADEAAASAALFNDLRDRLILTGMSFEDAEAAAGPLRDSIFELVRASGKPLQEAMDQARVSMSQMSPTADNAAQFLSFLGHELGVVTDEAGKVIPQLDAAEATLQRFLATGGKLPEVVARGVDGWNEGLATLGPTIDAQVPRVASAGGSVVDAFMATLGGLVTGTAETVVDVADQFRGLGPSIRDAVNDQKDEVRAAMADLRWAAEHPFSDIELALWLKGKAGSKAIRDGLKSSDPEVRAEARDRRRYLTGQMDLLLDETSITSYLTSKEHRQGLRSRDPDIRKDAREREQFLRERLKSLREDAKTYGTDTSKNYAAGLAAQQAISAITTAARTIAGVVADFFKTGSPTKLGPMSEGGGPEGWATQMVRDMARGALAGIPDLRGAMGMVAGASTMGLTAPLSLVPSMVGGAGAFGGSLDGTVHHEHRHTISREGAENLRAAGFDDVMVAALLAAERDAGTRYTEPRR